MDENSLVVCLVELHCNLFLRSPNKLSNLTKETEDDRNHMVKIEIVFVRLLLSLLSKLINGDNSIVNPSNIYSF